jgi:hypothetical protein
MGSTPLRGIPLKPDYQALERMERRSFHRACAALAMMTKREGSQADEVLRTNWRDDDQAAMILKAAAAGKAKRFGIHRNTITKMLSFSVPPGYRRRERPVSKKLGPYMAWIEAILEGDSQVHKKQRHTARRIFERLRDEQGFCGGYTIVREYVAKASLRRR